MARRLPLVAAHGSLGTDGHRIAVYPADVSGRFTFARRVVFVVLMAVYAALPWIPVGGHPAVFLDIAHREFFLFGLTFNAQDIWMTVFLLTGAAFGLLVLTAVAGRVWCGWACPQTVFLEGIYRRIERLVEGPREARRRRHEAALTFDGAARKIVSHTLYLAVSFVLAHVFLAYFASVRGVVGMMLQAPGEHPEAFLVVAFLTLVLYGNFAWFREQFCVVMCPYGRLQSLLVDADSLVVGYDEKRGEPRGKVGEEGRGDCVDCNRCVVVCPTGIDIRNGLQMDCIACTACIDACDEVMVKLDRPRGLVRYDSLRGLAGEKRRFLRPRLYVYAALLFAGVCAASLALAGRSDFEANALRVAGPPFTLDEGVVRNAFHLHLVNKQSHETTFVIEPRDEHGATFVVPLRSVRLAPLASVDAPVFVSVPRADYTHEFSAHVVVRAEGTDDAREVLLPFLGPAHGSTP